MVFRGGFGGSTSGLDSVTFNVIPTKVVGRRDSIGGYGIYDMLSDNLPNKNSLYLQPKSLLNDQKSIRFRLLRPFA